MGLLPLNRYYVLAPIHFTLDVLPISSRRIAAAGVGAGAMGRGIEVRVSEFGFPVERIECLMRLTDLMGS
jgi:hypothetical protein